MVMLDNSDIESDASSNNKMPSLEGSSDEENDGPRYIEPPVGDALITRRALNIQPKEKGNEMYREHIFHMRCVVQNKICSIIIDSGSCTNIASSLFVEKLNLPTLRHPKPYYLQ